MSRRDALTALWDRETYDADIQAKASAALSAGAPLSLVVVDVDHFKRVNDAHGHAMGDAVLAGIAGRLMSVVREKGQAYRYGGEEIVLVLPNCTTSEATAIAERARLDLAARVIQDIPVTASFGVACLPDHASSPASLFQAADRALLDAKNLGRNLVRVSGEPEPARSDARTVGRRLPEPGRLTESQRREIRLNYFRSASARCFEDDAMLRIEEINEAGSPGTSLHVHCPMCGMDEFLAPEERS